jgi:hypothetical protein
MKMVSINIQMSQPALIYFDCFHLFHLFKVANFNFFEGHKVLNFSRNCNSNDLNDDLERFKNIPWSGKKIVFINKLKSTTDWNNNRHKPLIHDLSWSDLVVIFTTEMDQLPDNWSRFNNPNIVYINSGTTNKKLNSFNLEHYITMVSCYHNNSKISSLLENFTHFPEEKFYLYDMILGMENMARKKIFDLLKNKKKRNSPIFVLSCLKITEI